MSFYDKMKNIANKACDFFNDTDNDNEDIDDVKVIEVPPSPNKSLFRLSSLSTPAPPPIPQETDTLSVRIAINGKEYGPYERATLREMISNGALTSDTFVYINGMAEWMPAHSVPEVNELFGIKKPLPKAPPIPWAESPSTTKEDLVVSNEESITSKEEKIASKESSGPSDNSISKKLDRLITAAIADGEITDLERQVLIRNAQEEGVNMDEFFMIVEARLYEQRKILSEEQSKREQEAALAKAKVEAALRTATSQVIKQKHENVYSSVRKCPACGAVINTTTATTCPECGYELATVQQANPIQPLIDKLEAIEKEYQQLNPAKQFFLAANYGLRKTTAIGTFKVPNTREAYIDFFMTACSMANSLPYGDTTKKAWKEKVKVTIDKVKTLYNDDPEFYTTLISTAKSFGIKIKK